MLAVEAPADDVLLRFIGVRLGIGELLEERASDPPVVARIVDGRSEKARGVGALRRGEAAALVAALVAVLRAGVPARRELVREAGGEFKLALAFPFAVETLAFRGGREVRRPDEAIVEEVLLQDQLCLELALVRPPARLDIERKANGVLVGAKYAINPFVGDRFEEALLVARVGVDVVGHERAGSRGAIGPVVEGIDAAIVEVNGGLQPIRYAVLDLGAELPQVEIALRLSVSLRDPLFEFAL